MLRLNSSSICRRGGSVIGIVGSDFCCDGDEESTEEGGVATCGVD